MSKSGVDLFWIDTPNEDGYLDDIRVKNKGKWFKIPGAIPKDSVGVHVQGLRKNTLYAFRLRAFRLAAFRLRSRQERG